MAQRLHCLLLFFLTISLLTITTVSRKVHYKYKSSPPSPSPSHSFLSSSDIDIIKSLCAYTDYPNLCVSTIESELPAPEPLHPATVLKLAMKAVRSKSYAAKAFAKALYHNATDKAIVGALKDCADLYDDVAYSLHNADEALRNHDKGMVGSELSSVCTDVDTCDEGFLEFKLPNPMKKYDDLLAKLAEICLVIAQAASLST
ncbi:hypothetical protein LUZ60_015844 [Juncus effusus]|nr:hypothetical protein LUZ60_015844 [Juncus effusus]